MVNTWTEPTPVRWSIADPGRLIRCWVAGFLRVGIGLSLLSTGLEGYFGQKNAISRGAPYGMNTLSIGFDPFIAALPYLAIGLGLALLVGFLTTAASIGAAFYSLLTPFMLLITMATRFVVPINSGPANWGNDPYLAILLNSSLSHLIPYAAMIWLSSVENHPFSIDSLVFGRDQITLQEPARIDRPELVKKSEQTEVQSSG